ncbi:dihydrolipoamide succinyltransferase [Niallia circulans]|uniref:2-oxoglutarate dehydrogenase complex dihydrolipoyllysine-residue succinyltransferase n=1 Tax=Shouchella clausii TaxID=79880 RepID=UPI000B96A07F|nr:2-oxoglutarate dehydrogenase complex dihydrolipoyllysine-residue succinyltransferase [Shouchella clausii]SPU22435.1 dihydrolipoamide succinyltransferase [Niallia circulans]AST97658.1 dihydrolipoamide succinyltransferase [Shouchella clausii]MBU8595002.1 2-oxoglutarate dehydrogenase complex dihydrolipoyllysine-residue succinyltransferase [Shouchella clausii]MCM3549372.1 2-oxoglutarate dehydrogenase complex dihydrolipoyllysine-residue succinyltransferase [Shouchella clausii]MCR1286119.1 2-oxog
MTEIKVPELGESITEGTISQWLKEVGDYVEQGEFIAELETDKVNAEIPVDTAGVIKEFKREPGDTVEIGEVIAIIDESGSAGGASATSESTKEEATAKEEAPQEEKQAEQTQQPEKEEAVSNNRPLASPAARKLAREKGISLDAITPTDPTGKIRRQDIEAHQAKPKQPEAPKAPQSPAPVSEGEAGKPVERQKMSRRRQTIAKRLVDVQHETAMLTTFNEVDMTAVMDLRSRRKDAFSEKHGVKLGFMSFFTKAVVGALKEFPLLNAEIQGDELLVKKFYDIGIAVSTDSGLVVPVLRDADRLSFAGIEKGIGELGKKARDNKLQLADMQGGTFTITNGGVFGSLWSTPILNAPQVGILGMHKIQMRPVAIDNERFENRPMMYLALSYDHRIVDGKEAVSFLVKIKQLIEDPEQLLLEG